MDEYLYSSAESLPDLFLGTFLLHGLVFFGLWYYIIPAILANIFLCIGSYKLIRRNGVITKAIKVLALFSAILAVISMIGLSYTVFSGGFIVDHRFAYGTFAYTALPMLGIFLFVVAGGLSYLLKGKHKWLSWIIFWLGILLPILHALTVFWFIPMPIVGYPM